MDLFNKKRFWTKVINSDTNDSAYNQALIAAFYKRVYRSKGEIVSLQVATDIDSEILFPSSSSSEDVAEAFTNSFPCFYITYSSKKEVYFNEDNFRSMYDRNLEGRVNNIRAESLGRPTEN